MAVALSGSWTVALLPERKVLLVLDSATDFPSGPIACQPISP